MVELPLNHRISQAINYREAVIPFVRRRPALIAVHILLGDEHDEQVRADPIVDVPFVQISDDEDEDDYDHDDNDEDDDNNSKDDSTHKDDEDADNMNRSLFIGKNCVCPDSRYCNFFLTCILSNAFIY